MAITNKKMNSNRLFRSRNIRLCRKHSSRFSLQSPCPNPGQGGFPLQSGLNEKESEFLEIVTHSFLFIQIVFKFCNLIFKIVFWFWFLPLPLIFAIWFLPLPLIFEIEKPYFAIKYSWWIPPHFIAIYRKNSHLHRLIIRIYFFKKSLFFWPTVIMTPFLSWKDMREQEKLP